MATKDNAEIQSINITPTENGCIVSIETKVPTKEKNSYDGYEWKSKKYNGDAELFNNILDQLGVEIKEESAENGGAKPKTTFDASKFR